MTSEIVKTFLDALPTAAGMVDSERRFLHVNPAFLDLFDVAEGEALLGSRPGELLHCIHCDEAPGGCGDSDSCKTCGSLEALLAGFETGRKSSRECRISAKINNRLLSYDLLVTSAPIRIENALFSMVILSDQSSEKRRRVLERLFFHDLLNTVGGLLGLVDVLKDSGDGGENGRIVNELGHTVRNLFEEVLTHRDLSAAERGDLEVNPVPLTSVNLLREVVFQLSRHRSAEGKTLVLSAAAENFIFVSDGKLLKRILVNMTKNALEACADGEEVLLDCRDGTEAAVFSAANPSYMTEDVRRGIFQRSFSTKGAGRGLGTYGMKLLAESYLGGRVYFETDPEKGTIFYVEIPKE